MYLLLEVLAWCANIATTAQCVGGMGNSWGRNRQGCTSGDLGYPQRVPTGAQLLAWTPASATIFRRCVRLHRWQFEIS